MRFLLKTICWANIVLGIIWIISLFILPGGLFLKSATCVMGQIGGKFSILMWALMFFAFGFISMNSVGKSYTYNQTAFVLAVVMDVFAVLDCICCFINPIVIHILIMHLIVVVIAIFDTVVICFASNHI